MTIPGLTSTQFCAILTANGYKILLDKYAQLEGVERIVVGKDGHNFAMRVNRLINFSEVVKRSKMLDLTIIPEDIKEDYEWCIHAYDLKMAQIAELDEKEKKANGEGKVSDDTNE